MSSDGDDYALLKRPAAGLAVITHPKYGHAMWCLVHVRKPKECVRCKRDLAKGSEAYSPITNGYNRMHRLCESCMEELSKP